MGVPDRNNDELQLLQFRDEIEREDEKRRATSRVGYYLINDWQSALTRYFAIVLAGQVLLIFGVVFAGGLPRGAADDPRTLFLFLPMATLPLFPFLILKTRYALGILAVLAGLLALCWFGVMAEDWILGRISS